MFKSEIGDVTTRVDVNRLQRVGHEVMGKMDPDDGVSLDTFRIVLGIEKERSNINVYNFRLMARFDIHPYG